MSFHKGAAGSTKSNARWGAVPTQLEVGQEWRYCRILDLFREQGLAAFLRLAACAVEQLVRIALELYLGILGQEPFFERPSFGQRA